MKHVSTIVLLTFASCGFNYSASAQDAPFVGPYGPNHRIIYRTGAISSVPASSAAKTAPAGQSVEIATGLNFWDGQTWSPSIPAFDVTPDGFVAHKRQHKVRL